MKKQLFMPSPVLLSMFIFFSLISTEVAILSWIEHSFPNAISSPFYEFKNIAGIAWSQNPWETVNEWVTLSVLEIGFRSESSASFVWIIYYHIPALLNHLIASLVIAFYFFRLTASIQTGKNIAMLVLASVMVISSTFYLSIAAHCSGANWLINVFILAAQNNSVKTSFILQRLAIDLPLVYLLLQWSLFTAGVITYFLLYRKAFSTSAQI